MKTYSKKSSPGPSLQPAHLASGALALARTRVMLRFPYSRVIAWDLEQRMQLIRQAKRDPSRDRVCLASDPQYP